MAWADVVGRLAGRAREDVSVGGPVAGVERLRGLAGADAQSGFAAPPMVSPWPLIYFVAL